MVLSTFLVAALLASSTQATQEPANQNAELDVVESSAGTVIGVRNLRPVAMEVMISAVDEPSSPSEFRVVPALGVVELFRYPGRERQEALAEVAAKWRLQTFMGDPAAIRPDPDHLYRLPFAPGKRYRLSQGFNGRESHLTVESRYALDFQLEVGEAVHAARAGLVVRAVDWFSARVDESRVAEANLVVVAHDDGTMAHYVHLARGSVLVEEGDRVERGQHLADVGLTGFTRGPHLHFVVRRERDVAVPIRFEGYETRDLSRRGTFRLPPPMPQ